MKNNLIEECYKRSVELLKNNSNKYGLSAAAPKGKAKSLLFHYNWIFSRDASICALGAIASNNKKLLKISKNSLITLSNFQSGNGQIPNAVNVGKKQAEFYYISSVDGTLWWLIALHYYNKHSGDKKLFKKLQPKIKKAIGWLNAQTSGETNLIEQSQAGDWADLMPRSGFVLYTNTLWYWAQKLYKLPKKELTESGINNLFYPFSKKQGALFFKKNFLHKRLRDFLIKTMKPTGFYLSHVNTFSAGRYCDVFGNLLSILFELPEKNFKNKIIKYLLNKKINKIYPVRVMDCPILKNDKEWNEAMMRNNLNKPYCYHNGGIWPFVGGFWIMVLAKLGNRNLAEKEIIKLAEANKVNDWEFNEWFHGKTGKPMGMPGQSWNAGMFLLACHYLKNDFKL